MDPGYTFAVATELADDKLIEDEILGKAMPHYVYSFPQEGQTITGLSVKGVNEVVRLLDRNAKSGYKIHLQSNSVKIETDADQNGRKGVMVTVFAENLLDGNSAFGAKFEPYIKKRKSGGTYEDRFALEKALAKAERNAKRKLIPEMVVIEMIKKLMKDRGQVLQISQPAVDEPAPMLAETKRTIPEPKAFAHLLKLIKASGNKKYLFETKPKVEGSKFYTAAHRAELLKAISMRVDVLDNL